MDEQDFIDMLLPMSDIRAYSGLLIAQAPEISVGLLYLAQ
jgi:hypothetical protein